MTSKRTFRTEFSRAFRRAWSITSGVTSTPSTSSSGRALASTKVGWPFPQARSSTTAPAGSAGTGRGWPRRRDWWPAGWRPPRYPPVATRPPLSCAVAWGLSSSSPCSSSVVLPIRRGGFGAVAAVPTASPVARYTCSCASCRTSSTFLVTTTATRNSGRSSMCSTTSRRSSTCCSCTCCVCGRKSRAPPAGRRSTTWTVQRFSEVAGMSRTAFTRRFTSAVGKPPMAYLIGGAAQARDASEVSPRLKEVLDTHSSRWHRQWGTERIRNKNSASEFRRPWRPIPLRKAGTS